MACQHFELTEGGADTFTVAMPKYTFGRGSLGEAGARAKALGMSRVALFTDPYLNDGVYVATVAESLKQQGLKVDVFSSVRIEPDDDTVKLATKFLTEGRFDGVVSVGGGSVIDTAKAAMVYSLYPAEFTDYFGPPIGAGKPVPGPLLPHLVCPTTSGTGSECTSVSVIRINDLNTKFVMGHPHLLPNEALVDPAVCDTLPPNVVASTGFDLLCHALECYTARAYTRWQRVDDPNRRTFLQGSNPWSDLAARRALEIVGEYLERGVTSADDHEARDALMWGASLAGMAFGNSGTHLAHAMSYGVTHLMHDITTRDYAIASPFIPHGISVVVNAPSIFRYLSEGAPERHLEAAGFMGMNTSGASAEDSGELVAGKLVQLMRATGMPNGLRDLEFTEADAQALAESSIRQTRAINNAPRVADLADMKQIYTESMQYW
ncbi:MAG: hydroxyacid-oxoacid transhydrogenase [Thiolinea sp.]